MDNNVERPIVNVFSPYDARDYKLTAANVEFPAAFELEVCDVKNQGSTGSCSAASMAGIMEYYNKLQHKEYLEMSIGYLYGNRLYSTHKGSGFVLRDMLKTAQKCGDAAQVDFPYNYEVPTAIDKFDERDTSIDPKAYINRISSYYKVSTDEEIKTALMQGCPVILGMQWYEKCKVKDDILTFESYTTSGSHAMFIYGWNEKGWLVQNSWGRHWGNNGRCIIPNSMKIRECWAVADNITEKQLKYKKPSVFVKFFHKVMNWAVNAWNTLFKKNK